MEQQLIKWRSVNVLEILSKTRDMSLASRMTLLEEGMINCLKSGFYSVTDASKMARHSKC